MQNESSEEAEKATDSLIAVTFEYPEPGRAGIRRCTREARERGHETGHLLFKTGLRHVHPRHRFLGATHHKIPPGEAREKDIRSTSKNFGICIRPQRDANIYPRRGHRKRYNWCYFVIERGLHVGRDPWFWCMRGCYNRLHTIDVLRKMLGRFPQLAEASG